MNTYNYLESVKESVLVFMRENGYTVEDIENGTVYDECFISDSVTGNASGSFFFDRWKAEEAICHNWDLIAEAWEEFELDAKELSRGAGFIDVTLRCYVLGLAIEEVKEQLENE